MKSIAIIGAGEVGTAIKKLAVKSFTVYCRDLEYDEISNHPIEVLHLCFPYSTKFVLISIAAIKAIKPQLVIINATVNIGTTRKIFKETRIPIAHTPIMGVHPHLAKYQTVFTKMIGAVNDESYQRACAHWKQLGASSIVRFNGPEETELGKLLETTYYGWNIVFNKVVHNLCHQTKTDFNQVYTKFNQIYNEGYAKTKPNVRRPVLEYVSGSIGGHCVIPNAEILSTKFHDPVSDFLLSFDRKLRNEV